MKLADVHPGVRWGALVALLVGVSQFNTGIKIVYTKWTADEAAAEAKKVAEDAKTTAQGVDHRFDEYIKQQKDAIETQNKIAEAISSYAKQNQQSQMQQMPNLPYPQPGLHEWDGEQQTYWCCPLHDRQACFDQDQWTRCD